MRKVSEVSDDSILARGGCGVYYIQVLISVRGRVVRGTRTAHI